MKGRTTLLRLVSRRGLTCAESRRRWEVLRGSGAAIAQFVIVNLVEGRVEVYEEPNVAERCYGVARVLHRGDTIPLRVPGQQTLGVPVADWLPETAGPSETASSPG